MVVTLAVTAAFQTSARLANAYVRPHALLYSKAEASYNRVTLHITSDLGCIPLQGLAVVIDMLLTTAFMSLLILTVWRKPWPLALAFLLVFGAIEAVFLSSSVLKVLPASWVLVVAGRSPACCTKPILTPTRLTHKMLPEQGDSYSIP
jgi:K+ potassium transporter